MRQSTYAAVAALAATAANAASLADLCTVANVQAALPANGTISGVDLIPSSVTASPLYNQSTSAGGMMKRDTTSYSYCNVSAAYTHTGKGDQVVLVYSLPDPSAFNNRFYVAGGGGYSLSTSITGGLEYGAVTGATDAGYDAFTTSADEAALLGNGSVNWDTMNMFGYQALGEMTQVGKAIAKTFYGIDTIYTYFEGCSDGGREGWSQIQRYGDEYDGVITGAPAFRYAQQQVNHLASNVMETTMNYFPPSCEMDKIVNMTIAACDGLDGRVDGVVSRTDLCKLTFDVNSTIGEAYYCAASDSSSLGFGFSKRQMGGSTSSNPEQNGTVSAEGAALASAIWEGLFNSAGQRIYLPWQIASAFEDASTTYDNTTETWGVNIKSTGGEFVTKFIQLVDQDNLSSLDNVTADTLLDWMNIALVRFASTLQTTTPDLTTFNNNGGKIIHYHGESDNSIPPSSSIHYYDSVRNTMYPTLGYNESMAALGAWYKFFLVPGAAHCGTNTLQPGPYPQANMDIMINWVENGVEPTGLNATISSGDFSGEIQMLCEWPLRPYWQSNSTSTFDCVYDQASIDSWTYTFDAFKIQPIY